MVRYMGMLTMASATQLRQQMFGFKKFFKKTPKQEKIRYSSQDDIDYVNSIIPKEKGDPKKRQCNVGARSLNYDLLNRYMQENQQELNGIPSYLDQYNHDSWQYQNKIKRRNFLRNQLEAWEPEIIYNEDYPNTTHACRKLCESKFDCAGWMFFQEQTTVPCRIFSGRSIAPFISMFRHKDYERTEKSQATAIYALCTKMSFEAEIKTPEQLAFMKVFKDRQIATEYRGNVSQEECEKKCEEEEQRLAWLFQKGSTNGANDSVCIILRQSPINSWNFLKSIMSNMNWYTPDQDDENKFVGRIV